MSLRSVAAPIVGAALLAGLPCPSAFADGSFAFIRIADETTPVPGRAGTFASLGSPSPDGSGRAVFVGASADDDYAMGWHGIYLFSGGVLSLVADESTPIPGGTESFVSFTFNGNLPFDGDTVAFGGFGTWDGDRGLYSFTGGSLSKVIDRSDAVPGDATGEFFPVTGGQSPSPYLSNGNLAFTNRQYVEGNAVFRRVGGVLQVVADRFMLVPGGTGYFRHAFARSIDRDGTTLFVGVDEAYAMALFTRSGDLITRIVDQDTPVPGGAGTFVSFGGGASGAADMDDGVVTFIGQHAVPGGPQKSGIYRYAAGTLTNVIDQDDPVPGLPDRFLASLCGTELPPFHEASFQGGHTVFMALVEPDDDDCDGDEYTAVFTDFGGTLAKLIGRGDVLDGQVVRDVYIGSDPVKGHEIGFTVQFDDWTVANYIARYTPGPEVVLLDVKPGDSGNAVNPSSRGLLTLAILTTPAFDATRVDPLSVTVGPLGAGEVHRRGHFEDADGDGDLDVVLHVLVTATGIACGDTQVSLTGTTLDGAPFTASDTIATVGCR